VPHPGSKLQQGQKKHRACGKGPKQKQRHSSTHFASTASVAGPSTHTIAHIRPQGLLQHIAVEEPDQSSYGNGPFPSFNEAIMIAKDLEIPGSIGTLQRLESMTLKRKRFLDPRSNAPSPSHTVSTVVPMDQDPEPERCSKSPKQAPLGFAYIPSPLHPRIITPDPEDTISLFGNNKDYQDFIDYDGPQTATDWYTICGTEPYMSPAPGTGLGCAQWTRVSSGNWPSCL